MGVLITGRSGMGKSEIALELVKKGHQIIADDRVDCYHIHNGLIGRCPELLQGYMEMRGIGVIDVTRMYGVSSFSPQAQIRLHLVLEPFKDSVQYDRVGIEEKEYTEIFGVKILKQRIPVSSGRPMSTIIETAVTNYLLMQNGIDSAKEFEQRVISQIERIKKKRMMRKVCSFFRIQNICVIWHASYYLVCHMYFDRGTDCVCTLSKNNQKMGICQCLIGRLFVSPFIDRHSGCAYLLCDL